MTVAQYLCKENYTRDVPGKKECECFVPKKMKAGLANYSRLCVTIRSEHAILGVT